MESIDLSYLNEISGGDKAVVIEMLALIIDEAPIHINNIKQHLNKEEWDQLGASAHSLKPMLLYVGLEGLNKTVQDIEQKSKNREDLETLPELVQSLDTEFDYVLKTMIETKEDLS